MASGRSITPRNTSSSGKPSAKRGVPSLHARRGLLLGLGALLLAIVVGRTAWKSMLPALRTDPRYRVTAASITLTEQPSWIRGDVKLEAFAQGGLFDTSATQGLSIMDPPEQLEERVATALRFHPWIADVGQIIKSSPNRLYVEVAYRRPLATLAIGRTQTQFSNALVPIDVRGILLPSDDLDPQMLGFLPRITVTHLMQSRGASLPRTGEQWTDPRIAGAIEIIERLGANWHTLPLVDITPSPTPEVRGHQRYYVYELRSTGNTHIAWGAAPSMAPSDESPFEEKLARLLRYTAQNGPLDSVVGTPEWIGVRTQIATRPRMVKREDANAPKTANAEPRRSDTETKTASAPGDTKTK